MHEFVKVMTDPLRPVEPTMEKDELIDAYNQFRGSVDLDASGNLPDLNHLIWYLLMGVPRVPADSETSADAPVRAIDQRTTILKAVFVEVNRGQPDAFLDEGLTRYDMAAQAAKRLLEEGSAPEQP